MIHLDRIVLREIRLPLVEPFRTANGTVVARRVLLVESSDVDGVTAWSECVAESLPTYSPDTVDSCWLALTEWIIPRVGGVSFASPRALSAALEQSVRGHAMARAAIEMGAWAIAAMRESRSLASLLAMESEAAASGGVAPRGKVPTGIALGMHATPERLAERVRAAASEGYRRIKVKVEPGRDVEFVRAARAALPSHVQLSVDANCSYSHADPSHISALRALDALDLAFIEQPLGHDDLLRHGDLQRMLKTPICLDESITALSRVEEMIALESGRMVNLKPGRVGGFTQATAIHDRCAHAGIPVWCGGMLETGIGRAYNVALASLPGFTVPGDLSPSARYWQRDIVTPAWTMDATGQVRVPVEQAGIGVEVDREVIDRSTTRTSTTRT